MLKEIENLFAVSGMEDKVREYLQKQVSPYCVSTQIDTMGNLHAYNCGEGPEFLLVTHMDEPGIIVTQITEDGYLRFETVGRINPAYLLSKRVFFENHTGIISMKAIHLTTKKEREIPVKVSQLLIDIGALSKKDAEAIVTAGDYGVLDIPFLELENGFVKGRGIAGRMGCLAAIQVLKKNPHCNIHVIFAVQREIGNRGILACDNTKHVDLTIVFDDIKAKTYSQGKENEPEAGFGVTLLTRHSCGIIDPILLSFCQNAARKEQIPLQLGTNELAGPETVFVKSGENRILPLSIPVRYHDSTAPVANQRDMDSMIQLTCSIIREFCQGGKRL